MTSKSISTSCLVIEMYLQSVSSLSVICLSEKFSKSLQLYHQQWSSFLPAQHLMNCHFETWNLYIGDDGNIWWVIFRCDHHFWFTEGICGNSNFYTQINLAFFKFQTPNNQMSSPVPKVKESPVIKSYVL